MQVPADKMNKIAPLFKNYKNTLVLSCLQGYMGRAWCDNLDNPASAQIIIGDFCFFGGNPDISLVRNFPADHFADFLLIIPENEEWADIIEKVYPHRFERFMRYAIKKEDGIFDVDKLTEFIKMLPESYSLQPIDKILFEKISKTEQLCDLCSVFPDYEYYSKYGLGFAILKGNDIVSGASSYTVYEKGIEIEVDTLPSYRRQGLALVCASRLILECVKRGLYPSWDAMNKESVALSKKLGYLFDREYVTYLVENPIPAC